MSLAVPDVEMSLEATSEERLADYLEFLRIPSISGLSEHAADTRAAAQFVADRLSGMGIEHVELCETGGHPMVYGEWLHADGAPPGLVYGHYDVQPVDPLELWVRPPFEPRVEEGRVYARGSADDKGQVHIHLSAAEAWLRTRGALPLNVRFVFEGEEESGSDHLDPWLEANRERLAADLAVISDTGFFEGNLPAITIGLRGITYLQVDVTGPDVDLHSGTYGGNVQNPAIALARIVVALKDADGRISVPGFYDEVRELSPRDREEFARLPLDEEAFRAGIGVPALHGEPEYTILERRGARPTLDVNGIWGGFQGEGSKTIIPAQAHAKISCRLVPDMDPQRTFERVRDAVLATAPPGVDVSVTLIGNGMWGLTPIDHPATRAAAGCVASVFGLEPVYLHEGGSIPICASFKTILGLESVLLGFTPPDDHAHAPNESMRLDNYESGIRTVVRYWQALSTLPLGRQAGCHRPARRAGTSRTDDGSRRSP
jgi:acetylornithine deacetylase/succinyl-diaminopimelate desuccinylase-like protein